MTEALAWLFFYYAMAACFLTGMAPKGDLVGWIGEAHNKVPAKTRLQGIWSTTVACFVVFTIWPIILIVFIAAFINNWRNRGA